MWNKEIMDRFRGCFVGGAVGAGFGCNVEDTELLGFVETTRCLLALEGGFIRSDADFVNGFTKGVDNSLLNAAPYGLYFSSAKRSAQIAAKCGENLAAATFAYMLNLLARSPDVSLIEIIRETLNAMNEVFDGAKELDDFLNLMVKAVILARQDIDDTAAYNRLEAQSQTQALLAKAIYTVVKYEADFEQAIRACYQEKSMTVRIIASSIMGTYLGMEKIPTGLYECLPGKSELVALADDLYIGRPYPKDEEKMQKWQAKYLKTSRHVENFVV